MLPASAWGAPPPLLPALSILACALPAGPGADPDTLPFTSSSSCPAHAFPSPRISHSQEPRSWQSALGQACLLPRLPVCPSLFFVSFLLLNVLAHLTWLWVGMSMGVCV